MARVFKNYKKFEAMREELKGDLTKSEEQFKPMAEQIKKEQTELKGFKEGTEEYSRSRKVALDPHDAGRSLPQEPAARPDPQRSPDL